MAKNVTSKVKINRTRVKQLSNACITALELTAQVLQDEIREDEVIPMDTGLLRGESFFIDYTYSKYGKVLLVHSTPYARRLYFHPEYNFNKEFARNAKGKWFEDYQEGGSKADFASNVFKKLYKKEADV